MRPRIFWSLVCALLVAAFALRLISLEHQPLHYDEGNNVYFGRLSFAGLLSETIRTSDTDPGGHRYALGFWMDAAGPSPFSIRLFSVAFSLLSVALTYRLARQVRLSPATALIAAATIVISPYAIDYGQQAKGYAMGAALALASWMGWIGCARAARAPSQSSKWIRAAAYVLLTAAMISTHYYTVLVLATQWIWALGSGHVLRSRRLARFAGIGALLQIGAVLPNAIWLAFTLSSSLHGSVMISTDMPALDPVAFWRMNLGEMSVGRFADPALQWAGAGLFTALAIWGAALLWRDRDPSNEQHAAFWLGVSCLVAFVGAFILQLRISFYSPRFLLFVLPLVAVLMARPLTLVKTRTTQTWRGAPGRTAATRAIGLVVAGLSLAGGWALFAAPVDPELEIRGLVAQLRPYLRPNDAALGGYIWMQGLVESYAPESRGTLTWFEDRYSTDTLDALMQPVTGHPRVWSFNFRRNPDAPDSLSVQWLKERGAEASRFSAQTTQTLLFDLRGTATDTPRHIPFGSHIQLDVAPVQGQARAGDSVPILLRWTATTPITDDLSIFIHLIGPDGQGVAQVDGAAVNGLAPSFTWTAGHVVVDRRALLIPAEATPGRYTVRVGLYRRADQRRLPTAGGADSAEIGSIEIRQVDLAPAPPSE